MAGGGSYCSDPPRTAVAQGVCCVPKLPSPKITPVHPQVWLCPHQPTFYLPTWRNIFSLNPENIRAKAEFGIPEFPMSAQKREALQNYLQHAILKEKLH